MVNYLIRSELTNEMIIFTKKKKEKRDRDQRSEGEGVIEIENSGKLIIYSCLLVIYIYI
jgi:hypothetical protein